MIRIEIREKTGREVQLMSDHFIYLKESNGKEHLWEWSHFDTGNDSLNAIYDNARKLSRQIEDILPDLPMSATR